MLGNSGNAIIKGVTTVETPAREISDKAFITALQAEKATNKLSPLISEGIYYSYNPYFTTGNAIIKGITTVEAIGTRVAPTLQKVASNPVVQNTAIGLGSNASLQLLSGQEFNWYELGGAGFAGAITPKLNSFDAIRVNMGIAMGVSLLGNNSNVGQDVGLAGIGSFVGSKIKYPILGNYISETIQKYPSLLEKYFDEKKEDK